MGACRGRRGLLSAHSIQAWQGPIPAAARRWPGGAGLARSHGERRGQGQVQAPLDLRMPPCPLAHWDLRQLTVRGFEKVRAVVLWYALTNNILQGNRLANAIKESSAINSSLKLHCRRPAVPNLLQSSAAAKSVTSSQDEEPRSLMVRRRGKAARLETIGSHRIGHFSIQLDAGLADQSGPALVFGRDEGIEPLRPADPRLRRRSSRSAP